MLSITILCSDSLHPVNSWLERWQSENSNNANIRIARNVLEADGGDFLFLISCQQIVTEKIRDKYDYSLVLHASDLPQGRGMSPHIWQILEGATSFPVTLLDCADPFDTSAVWNQKWMEFDGTELFDEIDAKIFDAELELMSWAIKNCANTQPREQSGEATIYPRRTASDSRIEPSLPLEDQFDTLRVANPDRYPAFFEFRGCRYKLRLERFVQ